MLVVKFAPGCEMRRVATNLWVFEDFALVVADYDLLVVVMQYVAGINWHLAATAGSVDHILRHAISRGVPSQAFDDLNPLGNRGAQMRGAVDEVALIDVVGSYAAHQQLVHEC